MPRKLISPHRRQPAKLVEGARNRDLPNMHSRTSEFSPDEFLRTYARWIDRISNQFRIGVIETTLSKYRNRPHSSVN